MGLRQAVLFHNRERRLLRFNRVGLGSATQKFPGPDAAIPNPLTGTQNVEPASLLSRIESFSGAAAGVIVQTGGSDSLRLTLSGVETINLTVSVATVTEIDVTKTTGIDLTAGPHFFVVAFKPITGPSFQFKVFVDGRLIIDAIDAQASLWSSATATWDYASGLTPVGKIDPLELFVGEVPAIF